MKLTQSLIGVIHLDPLPGASNAQVSMQSVVEKAVKEASLYKDNGFDGVIIENAKDRPFYPCRVPRLTLAAMTSVAQAVRSNVDLPLGIAVLRNDARSAIDIAAAVNAEFIRVNVLCGTTLTAQGMIQGEAHKVLRHRDQHAPGTQIFADVAVKYSRPWTYENKLFDEIRDVGACADALIVSGTATGQRTDIELLCDVKERSSKPIIVGSGVDEQDCKACLSIADALIVGSSLKENGVWNGPLDSQKVARFAACAREKAAPHPT